MSFPQLGYPQFLTASQEVYGGERTGVMPASPGDGGSDSGATPANTAAAIAPMLGMYANPWTVQNYSAFLPYNSAELALLSQMVRDSLDIFLIKFRRCTINFENVFIKKRAWRKSLEHCEVSNVTIQSDSIIFAH